MKKIVFLFLFLMSFQFVSAQELLMETELETSPDAFGPKFNGGGVDKFYEFINKEFDFTKVKKAGRMIFSFNVNENGELKKIKVIEFPDVDAASEIIRVLNKSPKWESAKRAGKPFSTEIKMPIVFRLKQTPIAEKVKDTIAPNSKKTSIETVPNFSGGLKSFMAFISKNYQVPDVSGLKGKVIVSFVIEKDGSLVEIKVLKHIGYGTGDEAIRVLKLSPKWTPGEQDGKKVRCTYTLPINISK